jgi:small subunit ribosomal protein S5
MALINPDTLNLSERVIRTNKVQKTHKGGRTMSWNVLVVVGDGEGYVGAGVGKARAIPDAIRKGFEAAKRNLIKVPIVGSTIPHEVNVRVSAAQVLLKPAAPGTGVVAGGSVRALLEAAGVKDVLAKSLGSSNPINNAWATMQAFRQLKRATDVARLRNKEVSEIVPRQMAIAASEAEQHDASVHQGVETTSGASVAANAVSDEPVVEAAAEVVAAVAVEAVAPIAEPVPVVETTAAEGETNG